MNEKEPIVCRNVPKISDSSEDKSRAEQAGAILDLASFEYLFEQVTFLQQQTGGVCISQVFNKRS